MTRPVVSAGPREWIGLAVLALPTLLLSMDVTILHLAVPQLAADLRPGPSELLWILDVYGFMIAGFLVTMGSLGDRIGRRRLMLSGALAFGAASVLCAFATSPGMLIVGRALLGIAGATLMPATLALISTMFPDARQRSTAIGVWASCLSAGVAVGPVVGGLLLQSFWWGSLFLIGVPVMIVLLVAGPLLLPEYRDPSAGRIDLVSVGLSLAAILPVVFGVKQLAETGVTGWSVGAVVAGLALGVAFVRRQRALADPMLDLALFTNREFRVALLVLLGAFGMLGGIYLFVTQYLQLVAGLSPLAAGLWLLPAAVTLVVVSVLTPVVARRIRPGYVAAGALTVSGAGYLVLALVGAAGGLPVLVAGFALVYIGTSPTMVLGTDLVVATAPPEKAGSAAALSETGSELGLALGVALLGVVGISVYRGSVELPSGTAADAFHLAGESLTGAAAVAGQLPPADADALLGPAREAFTAGLNTVAVVCAAGSVLLAIVAARQLRHVATQ